MQLFRFFMMCTLSNRTLVKSAYRKTKFLIYQPKHLVGTQKHRLIETDLRLIETVLLSTQSYVKSDG